MGLFSPRKRQPATVPGDLIRPLGFWNSMDYAKAISLDLTLCFNDVLDPELLRLSLDTLIQKDGWRKFGARLRLNEKKELEYHIPQEFHEKRPAFRFSVDNQDMPVSNHPHLAQLTSGNRDKPAILGPFDHFRYDVRSRDAPEVIDDWLYSDAPQLSVHVVAFEDATFVTVTFLHTLMDAMGFSALLKGWTAVLRGKEDEIPPIISLDDDPLATIHQVTPASKYILANKTLQGWNFFWFVVNYVFDLIWHSKEEERLVFMPGKYLNELRDSALAELYEQSSTSDAKEAPFLSESDVLISWWSRIMFKASNMSPSQPLTLMNVFDIRALLAENGSIPSANTAMISNAVWPTSVLTTVGDIISKPVSYLASRFRHAIDTHRNIEQVQAFAALNRETQDKSGHPALLGDPGAFLFTFSNWNRGKLFHQDFSPAVVHESGVASSESRANPPGKVSFLYISGKFVGYSPRNAVAVLGKDSSGNWWMNSRIRAGIWSRAEKLL